MKRLLFLVFALFVFNGVFAKRYSFNVKNNDKEFKITLDTEKNILEFYNYDTDILSIGHCTKMEASGKTITLSLKPGGIKILYSGETVEDMTFVSFFPGIGTVPANLTMQEGLYSYHHYIFKAVDEEKFETTLASAVSELNRTGRIVGQVSSSNKVRSSNNKNSSNNSRNSNLGSKSTNSSSQSQKSKTRVNYNSNEMPLKFETILKLKHGEGKNYQIQSKHYASGSIIYVYTNNGNYLDQTSYGDYDLKIDYVIGDGWLSIKEKDPRHIFLNIDANKGDRSRIARLIFTINGEEQGVISLIQLAEGATMSW